MRLTKSPKPIPSIYPSHIQSPTLPKAPSTRRSPRKRSLQPDEYSEFIAKDNIHSLQNINEKDCPVGFTFTKYDDHIVLYRQVTNELHIPEVKECIRIDNELHVKLFYRGSPVPLPQWFRYGHNCKLTKKSMLENFPPYLNIQGENFSSVFEELSLRQFKKKEVFSTNLIQYALLLRYTSLQTYKLLLKEFPLPSVSLLNKIIEGNIDIIKTANLLYENGSLSKDIMLIFDEMYLQKCVEYTGGEIIGLSDENEVYKSILCFMIVGLKENLPYMIKATPVTKLSNDLIKTEILKCLDILFKTEFKVRGIVCDNHNANVSTFNKLVSLFHEEKDSLFIYYQTQKIYLYFDPVHLVKNIRNNLLNNKRFIFPSFEFFGFYDDITVKSGEVSWKLLHDVHEKDILLGANLRKAPKLSNKVLHPGKFKQNVQVALDIFHETTTAAIKCYYPDRQDAADFLHLINVWWTISNSKDQYNFSNRLGNAAVKDDNKPAFLREMASWLKNWDSAKTPNTEKFTLTTQTSSALQRTLQCQASLIEDLLDEGFEFVLTSRFQSDPIEKRFGQYRQMSGGRFLVSLKDVIQSERILKVKSLVKESIDIIENDIIDTETDKTNKIKFLEKLKDCNFDNVVLSEKTRDVAAHISGYIGKKVSKKYGECCKNFCIADKTETLESSDYDYIKTLSRGGLTIPSINLINYVCDSFAFIDYVNDDIISSGLTARKAALIVLNNCIKHDSFLCSCHWTDGKVYVDKIIVNVYFNNKRKIITDEIHKDNIASFKKRQREK